MGGGKTAIERIYLKKSFQLLVFLGVFFCVLPFLVFFLSGGWECSPKLDWWHHSVMVLCGASLLPCKIIESQKKVSSFALVSFLGSKIFPPPPKLLLFQVFQTLHTFSLLVHPAVDEARRDTIRVTKHSSFLIFALCSFWAKVRLGVWQNTCTLHLNQNPSQCKFLFLFLAILTKKESLRGCATPSTCCAEQDVKDQTGQIKNEWEPFVTRIITSEKMLAIDQEESYHSTTIKI